MNDFYIDLVQIPYNSGSNWPVTFGFSRQKGPLLSGRVPLLSVSRYFWMVKELLHGAVIKSFSEIRGDITLPTTNLNKVDWIQRNNVPNVGTAGFHMTPLKFKLHLLLIHWRFTFMMYKSSWKLIILR